MKVSSRSIAIDVLCKWEKSGKPIDQVLEQTKRYQQLADQRDRYLTFALIYGTLRQRGYLDWVLADFSSHPLKKMKPHVLNGLRIGLYQLLFMDRIPDSAAINETVEALKAARQPRWLFGFVNGLLRDIVRRKENLPDPEQENTSLPDIAGLNHPQWLINRWVERYGRTNTTAICRSNNMVPPLCLRINTSATSIDSFMDSLRAANIVALPGSFAPEAIILHDYRGPIAEIPGYETGLFQVQDEAAQLISMLLSPMETGKTYLDGCAGLGGKTSHLAQMAAVAGHGARPGLITAVEPSSLRIERLRDNLKRLKLTEYVTIVEGRLENLQPSLAGTFTEALIDAPCSGLGVVRRHPDIRWSRTEKDMRRYQQMQLALLEGAALLLEPSAILVYATCSMEPEENDAVVEKFLAVHADFFLTDCRDHLPASAVGLVDEQGFFRTVPDKEGLGGFFAARLIRKRGSAEL
jgi:16S rRNA (cytosine967-C5)-methyltransferase